MVKVMKNNKVYTKKVLVSKLLDLYYEIFSKKLS